MKFCKHCNQYARVGFETCFGHSYLDSRSEATPKKTKSKKTTVKKKPIKRRSTKRQLEAKEYGQNDMFLEKWNNSIKKSYISCRDLSHLEVGSNYWRCSMAHILPKSKYTKYRTYINNLVIVHPEEHQLIDQGTEDQRTKYKKEWEAKGYSINWDVFYELQEKLKTFYPFY